MAILKCSDGTEVKISAETEAELRKQFGPKPKFEPRDIHNGCFEVDVDRDCIRIKTGTDYPRLGCVLRPDYVDTFIHALQDAKAFIERKK